MHQGICTFGASLSNALCSGAGACILFVCKMTCISLYAGSLSVGAIIAVVFVFVLIAAVVSLVLSCTLICYKINHRVRNGDKNLHNNQQLTISLHRPVTEETGNNCAKANEQLHDVSEQIGRSSSYRAIAITADQVI